MILQVIRGKLTFHSHEGSVNLSPGESLKVKEKKHYILTTGEETMFIITLFTASQRQTDYIMTDNSEIPYLNSNPSAHPPQHSSR
jgi:quercetin dioxygenase-like cupin family protein